MNNNIDRSNFLSKYEVKELFVAANLGTAVSINEQTHGLGVSIFNIKSQDGNYIFKSTTKKCEYDEPAQDPIVHELSVTKALNEAGCKFCPTVVYSDVSREKYDFSYAIFKIEGVPYKKGVSTIADRKRIMFELGEELAKIHDIKGVGFGSEKIGIATSWDIAYKKMIDDVISELIIRNTRIDTNRIYSVLSKTENLLKDVPSSLVHFNLWKGNVYINNAKNRFLLIANWGDAIWGDPAADFIRLNPIRGVGNNKSFIRGYKSISNIEFDKTFKIRKNLIKLYLGLCALIKPIMKWRGGTQKYIHKKIEGRVMIYEALKYLEKTNTN